MAVQTIADNQIHFEPTASGGAIATFNGVFYGRIYKNIAGDQYQVNTIGHVSRVFADETKAKAWLTAEIEGD